MMDKQAYRKHNETIKTLAKKYDIEYWKQYSYNGPRVTRTKLWGIHSTRSDIKKYLSVVENLKYVKSAVYERQGEAREGHYCYPSCIRIIYK